MAEPILEPFELPYNNWYDPETGRIFKDILIKNFNAIEAKINEISAIDIENIVTPPDISTVTYPDVELSDEDKDSQILNLKSYLNIVNLINLPLVVETDGNITINKVEYWGSDYRYHTVTKASTAVVPTTSEPYMYLNYSTKTIYRSSSADTPENSVLIGVYTNNKLYTKDSSIDVPTDVLSMICQQKTAKLPATSSVTGQWYQQVNYASKNGNQTVLAYHSESENTSATESTYLRLGLN